LESLAVGFQCSIEDILYFNLELNTFPEKMDRVVALEQECAQLQAEVGFLRQLVGMVRSATGGAFFSLTRAAGS